MRISFIPSLLLLAASSCLAATGAQRADTSSAPAPAAGVMMLSPMQQMSSYSAGVQADAVSPHKQDPEAAQNRPDYAANLSSDVFGAKLFTGSFMQQGATQFNPDYLVASGDQLAVRLWGGFNYEGILTVDPQGNLFVPQVGPVKVLGVRNQDLQQSVESAIRKVFRANVSVYASLAKAQPVRVFVGGYVNRPGLYSGTSMDSLLHYVDQAGGIDPQRGSFLQVQVKRGQQVRASVNLYDFLLKGLIPLLQLGDGDVIFVAARHSTVKVNGFAENTNRFEFLETSTSLAEISQLAKPLAQVTNVRVVRNTGAVRNVDYYALEASAGVRIGDGDEVEYTADKKPGTITVRVEGEHQSAQEYVLPYGTPLGVLLQQVRATPRSDMGNMQLFRQSVRERQKALLQTSMSSLEAAVLTARSGTVEEAQLRKEEAALVLQWIERARKIEPRGQVVISQSAKRDELVLENGDVLRIPAHSGLILVSGEVLFPNAIAYDSSLRLADYVRRTGGLTQHSDGSRIIIAHPDGSFDDSAKSAGLNAGDEILVLPKVDVKSRQIWKEMTQIIYQIAIAAKIAVGI